MVPELAEALRQAADRRGVTVNDFIVDAVATELARDPDGRTELSLRLEPARARLLRQALLATLDELLPEEVAVSA